MEWIMTYTWKWCIRMIMVHLNINLANDLFDIYLLMWTRSIEVEQRRRCRNIPQIRMQYTKERLGRHMRMDQTVTYYLNIETLNIIIDITIFIHCQMPNKKAGFSYVPYWARSGGRILIVIKITNISILALILYMSTIVIWKSNEGEDIHISCTVRAVLVSFE